MKLLFLCIFLFPFFLFSQESDKEIILKQQQEIESMKKLLESLQKRVIDLEKDKEKGSLPEKNQEQQEPIQDKDSLRQMIKEEVSNILETKKDPKKIPVESFWKGRFSFETEDKKFTMTVGGRVAVDFIFGHEDRTIHENQGPIEDSMEFRSVRPTLEGTVCKHFFYKIDLSFAGGTAAFFDVYMGISGLPLSGKLILGHFKEPFCLETQRPAPWLTFMERNSVEILSPNRNLGIAYFGNLAEERISFSFGFFRDTPNNNPPKVEGDSGSYAFTARIAGLPYYENKGETLVHLGIGYSYRNPINDEARYRAKPEARMTPYFVDTGILRNVEDNHLLGLEGACVIGPLSIQSELICSFINYESSADKDNDRFWGYYVYATYFLTGEHRNYDKERGRFLDIKPEKSFLEGGYGAWEMAVCYSKLDLNDEIRGGRMDNIIVGLNWYPNSHLRIMFDYIYSMLHNEKNNEKTDAHIFMTRFQVRF
mgnify:CR=1 FL=1